MDITPSCTWRDDGAVSSGNQRAKRHHLVPEAYLMRWAEGGSRVHAVVRDDLARTFPTHPRNLTVNNNFFTVDTAAGPSDIIEREYLDPLDGAADKAIKAITDGIWPLVGPHRHALARFIAVQQFRSNRGRERRSDTMTRVTQMAAKMRMVQPGGADEIAAARAMTTARVAETPNRMAKLLPIAEEMVPGVLGMQWTLIEAGAGEFLTCDHPILLVPRRDHSRFYGVGLFTADHLALPLSPRLLLKARIAEDAQGGLVPADPRGDRRSRAPALSVRAYNCVVAAQAERTIIMRSPDQWPIPNREPS